MGWTRKAPTYELVFTDPEMAGLEVTMRSLSVGAFLDLTELASRFGDVSATAAADADEMFTMLAGALIGWNLEDDDGKPVPADSGGVKSLDLPFVNLIITTWMQAMASVDPTLLASFSASGISQEESLELASLSRSLSS